MNQDGCVSTRTLRNRAIGSHEHRLVSSNSEVKKHVNRAELSSTVRLSCSRLDNVQSHKRGPLRRAFGFVIRS